MTKKRLVPAAMLVAFAALFIVLNWSSVARAAIGLTFGSSNVLQFIGGVTASAAKALPVKMNADGDGVTGHLVVDCSTGCSGGGGGSAPFTGGASGVATAINQSIGLFAYNGATMDSLLSVNSGQLKTTLYDLFGNTLQYGQTANTDGNSALAVVAPSAAYGFAFNGTTWDRLQDDASKNLKVVVNAALPAGTNILGTFLPPLTGVSGTGTAGAVSQAIVAGCAFTTALPTITTGNVGPQQCTTNGVALVAPPLTGLNSTGTAGAVNQAIVADCNFTTAPATVVTTNVVPISCNNKAQVITDAQSIAGAAITTATGVSGQHIYPANTSGGGCAGINLSTGTQITRVNLAPVTITASEATTQIVALAASKFIHICGVTITGVLSTGGAINLITGTGVNCVTGTTTLATYQFGVNTAGFVFDKGTGEQSMIDSATASEICVSSGAFVSTQAVTLNLVYAQY